MGDSKVYYSELPNHSMDFNTFEIGMLDTRFKEQKPSLVSQVVTNNWNKELSNRGIKPIAMTFQLVTPYDQFVNSQVRGYYYQNTAPAILSGLNSLPRLATEYYFELLIVACVIFFFGGSFSLEREEGDHIVFLLTQPTEKKNILFDKLKASLVVSFKFVIILILAMFILGALFGGIGQPDFPIIEYLNIAPAEALSSSVIGPTFQFMDLWVYWLKSIILLSFMIVFVLTLSHFISIYIKNRVVLSVLVLSLLGIGYLAALQGNLGTIGALLPTSYLQPTAVVDGSMKILSKVELISYNLGLIMLSIWSLFFFLLSSFIIKRKELLI